jgi:DNA-binding GntR family transcriptional regulator
VALVTVRDIHEVFDLRLLLEPEAARRAAGRVDAAAPPEGLSVTVPR